MSAMYLKDGSIDLKKLKQDKNTRHRKLDIPLECAQYKCRVAVRQSIDRPSNFSVILIYTEKSKDHIITRYNGYHGEHTNKLTGETISGPHIHKTTELYQTNTDKPEGYAEPTGEYVDLPGAVKTFITDMNISVKAPSNVKRLEDWQ